MLGVLRILCEPLEKTAKVEANPSNCMFSRKLEKIVFLWQACISHAAITMGNRFLEECVCYQVSFAENITF